MNNEQNAIGLHEKGLRPFLYSPRSRRPLALVLTLSLLAQGVQPGVLEAKRRPGEIQQVDISDTDTLTTVRIKGRDLSDYQSVVLRDPKGKLPPQMYVTLNNTTIGSGIPNMQTGTGVVLSVVVSSVAKDPPVSQIIIALASNANTQIKKRDGIAIEIDKKGFSPKPNALLQSPIPSMPVQAIRQDQPLQAGDSLSFAVSPAEELSRDVVVDENGKIAIPLVGAMEVAGLTADQLSRKITNALSHYVTNPKVDVLIRQYTGKQLSITGEVARAGLYPYHTSLRLLEALTLAGGILPSGNKRQVRVLRGTGAERRLIVINVEDVLASGDIKKDFMLEAGDMVEVSKGTNGITIFGEIERPGTFDYIYDMRILDLISLCGGFKDGASQNKIKLIRGEEPNTKITTIYFSKVLSNKKHANVPLMPGDIIYVPTKPLWGFSAYAAVLMPIATLLLAASTVFLATKK
jgi:polysaccharide export outer membrane protein